MVKSVKCGGARGKVFKKTQILWWFLCAVIGRPTSLVKGFLFGLRPGLGREVLDGGGDLPRLGLLAARGRGRGIRRGEYAHVRRNAWRTRGFASGRCRCQKKYKMDDERYVETGACDPLVGFFAIINSRIGASWYD